MSAPTDDPRGERSTITLRAPSGAVVALPLGDAETRAMVVATARAIAERTGVTLTELAADERSLTATVEGPAIVAMGFAVELRRVSEAWHRHKFGSTLWGDDGPESAA